MALDLSKVNPREAQQLEQMGRRDSIFPERRGVRARDFEAAQDMRSARRGDVGGAEEIMRTLGIAKKGVDDFGDYAQRQYAQDEADNIARGYVDQQTGAVNTAMLEKSEGYRNAVTKGRTITEFTNAMRRFDEELRGFIEDQDDPDLGNRRAQVVAKLEKFYNDFAIDQETGQLKGFLQSPGAMRYLAEAVSTSRSKIEQAAMDRIEARFNEEALSHFDTFIANQAAETGTVDLVGALSLLPKTIPDETIRARTVSAVTTAASQLKEQGKYVEAVKLLDGITGVKPAAQGTIVDTEEAAGDPSAAPAPEGAPAAPQGNPGRVKLADLTAAVMWAESRGNPGAVSPKGAVGTMQTMPATLTDPGFGVTPARNNSPAELERVGKDYLKAMLSRYNGDLVLALSAYNAGPGRADEWQKEMRGKTNAQKIAMIPFAETKGYVQSILGRLGVPGGAAAETAEVDPITADPSFKLRPLGVDPITEYEQSGDVPAMLGTELLKLSASDRSKLMDARNALAAQAKNEWTQKRDEELEFNASAYALRIAGQGEPLGVTEIREAIRDGRVKPADGLTLFNMLRTNQDRAQAAADRRTALADREQAKADEEQATAIAGRYTKAILSGKMTAPEARSALLAELPTIRNPRVQVAVTNAVMGAASDIENLRSNSAPVRDAARRFTDYEAVYAAKVPQSATSQVSAIFNLMQGEYATRIQQGEDPAAAEAAVVGKYKPRLDGLSAPKIARERPSASRQ